MTGIIRLDWTGRRRLRVDDDGLELLAPAPYVVPFPLGMSPRPLVSNQRFPFSSITFASVVKKRDPWDLVLGAAFSTIGVYWLFSLYHHWIAFALSALWCLAFGAWPLTQYLRGEPYVLVATEDRAMAFPYLLRLRHSIDRLLKVLSERGLSPSASVAQPGGDSGRS